MNNDTPYIEKTIKCYDENYGDDRVCNCGHQYHRHFDGYDGNGNQPVGCKYCACHTFVEASLDDRPLVLSKDDIKYRSTPFIGLVKLSEDYNAIGVLLPLDYMEELESMAIRFNNVIDKYPDLKHHSGLMDSFIAIALSARNGSK